MEVHILSFATVEEEEKHEAYTCATIASHLYLCNPPILQYLPKQLILPPHEKHFLLFLKKTTNQQPGRLTEVSKVSKLIAGPGFLV